MTILNLMLGKKRGGLEQAALDYAESLDAANIRALTIISPQAWVEAPLVAAGMPHESLANAGGWDPLAAWRLRHLARTHRATAVICHGNRALGLALRALKGRVPVIAVAHNYNTSRFTRADHCFAITEHLRTHLHGHSTITVMPNMVRIPEVAPHGDFQSPPVIGAMGRFVAKKGFERYIEALAILKSRGVPFRAILGGDGERAEALRSLAANCALGDALQFTGWVKDKAEFFDSIDLFVLPSHHEPFGIVLIEAMAYGVPTVTTASEGPAEIVRPGIDALLVPKNDAVAIADALQSLLADHALAQRLAVEGKRRVAQDYSMAAMATRLNAALAPYL